MSRVLAESDARTGFCFEVISGREITWVPCLRLLRTQSRTRNIEEQDVNSIGDTEFEDVALPEPLC